MLYKSIHTVQYKVYHQNKYFLSSNAYQKISIYNEIHAPQDYNVE